MNQIKLCLISLLMTSWAFAGETAKTVKVQEINRKTSGFLNKQIVVHGEIERMLNSNAFILDGDGVMNDEVFVVRVPPSVALSNPNVAAAKSSNQIQLIQEDDEIQLTGTVRRMSISDIRKEFGLEFDPKIVAEFEGTFPVLITTANDIQVTGKD